MNAEYATIHQDNGEGDAPSGPDARSLYISCQYSPKTYIQELAEDVSSEDLAKKETLADAFVSPVFHGKNSNLALIKTMTIAGQQAFEYSNTNKIPNGPTTTIYRIALEKNRNVYEFELGSMEYDTLSETVKRIIGSLSFVP